MSLQVTPSLILFEVSIECVANFSSKPPKSPWRGTFGLWGEWSFAVCVANFSTSKTWKRFFGRRYPLKKRIRQHNIKKRFRQKADMRRSDDALKFFRRVEVWYNVLWFGKRYIISLLPDLLSNICSFYWMPVALSVNNCSLYWFFGKLF